MRNKSLRKSTNTERKVVAESIALIDVPMVFPNERNLVEKKFVEEKLVEEKLAEKKVAFLVANGIEGAAMTTLKTMLEAAGAMVIYIAPVQEPIETTDGTVMQAWLTLENAANMLFDALVLPDGDRGVQLLASHKLTKNFICNQYRQGKIILAIGASQYLLASVGLLPQDFCNAESDGVLLTESKDIINAGNLFIEIMIGHEHLCNA